MMNLEELEAEVLQLPAPFRARLAEALIASLDDDAEIERAWAEEAERRYWELESGKVQGIPMEQVFAEARAHLA